MGKGGVGLLGQKMDDKDMAHWHGPVYITTIFNERTKSPPFFYFANPAPTTRTHI